MKSAALGAFALRPARSNRISPRSAVLNLSHRPGALFWRLSRRLGLSGPDIGYKSGEHVGEFVIRHQRCLDENLSVVGCGCPIIQPVLRYCVQSGRVFFVGLRRISSGAT
jgi:hypothetical protein